MSDLSEPIVEAAPAATEAPAVQEGVVEGETIVEPVAGEPSATTPIVEGAPAPEAAPAVDDPFSEYGGKEAIEAAHRLYTASKTEDGVIQLFLEAGQSLGLGLPAMQQLFESLAGEQPEPPDPDEPLTRGEFEALQAKEHEAAQAARQKDALASARTVVQDTVKALGLDPADPSTQVVLNMGDKYLKEGDLDPNSISDAIRKGHADYEATIEKEAKAYLQRKVEKGETVPSAPAGSGAPATAAPEEPKNIQEAIKAARKKLGISV